MQDNYEPEEAKTRRQPPPDVVQAYPATQEAMPPVPMVAQHRPPRRNLMGGCLAIGGAVGAFGVVAIIVAVILIPPIYRAQRPELQEIWCNRADSVGMGDFICDLKPTVDLRQPSVEPPSEQELFNLLNPTETPLESGAAVDPVSDATQAPQPTPTLAPTESGSLPTATSLPANTPTTVPTFTPTPVPLPVSYSLDTSRLRYHAQGWNNCGPATLTMGMSYFGYTNNQYPAANYLKPNGEDKNVSPYQMEAYVNQIASENHNVEALYRVGGNMELLKRLIANEFPVIIEKGYEPSGYQWMGHYLLLMGYDDSQQTFLAYDSFLGNGGGSGLRESYDEVENYWWHFNNLFMVIYDPARRTELLDILGDLSDPRTATTIALENARQVASNNPEDNWAWFNLGSSYTMLGQYQQAASAFDQAFALEMPWRTLWYLHYPYQAYYATQRYDSVLAHTRATESTTPYVEETFYYRGLVLAAQQDTAGAVRAFNQALSYNRNFTPAEIAREAVQNGTFSTTSVVQGFGG